MTYKAVGGHAFSAVEQVGELFRRGDRRWWLGPGGSSGAFGEGSHAARISVFSIIAQATLADKFQIFLLGGLAGWCLKMLVLCSGIYACLALIVGTIDFY